MELFRRLEECRCLTFVTGFLAFTGKHTLALLCIHDLDWRMPVQVWGGALQVRFATFPDQAFLYTVRRLSFDYAWLLIFLGMMYVGKKLLNRKKVSTSMLAKMSELCKKCR